MSNESKTLKIFCFVAVAMLVVSAAVGVICCLEAESLKPVVIRVINRDCSMGTFSLLAGFMFVITAFALGTTVFEGIRLANTPSVETKATNYAVMSAFFGGLSAFFSLMLGSFNPLTMPFLIGIVDLALGVVLHKKAAAVKAQAER